MIGESPGRPRLIRAFILVLPFAVLYWLFPFAGGLTLGNDYTLFPIQHQMEQQYSLARGTVPLYAPGFAGGRSAAALTLGGMHHPLSFLAAHSPGYWDGAALEWNTFWRLVSLGFAHLVLYVLMRKLGLRADVAFVVSFLAVYNLRTLDLFRYGAALENHVGFLLLCGAMGHFFVTPRPVAGPVSVIGATYLMIVGGHPQIAYYGAVGAVLVGVLIPFFVAALRPDLPAGLRATWRFTAALLVCGAAGLALASPYTMPFYVEFLRDAPSRVARSYGWSLEFSDSVGGILDGFVRPLRSDVHSAFGSSSLILAAALAPFGIAAMGRGKTRRVMILTGLAFMAILLCSFGGATPVHRLFWTLFPLADSFRVPGRITMILLPLFMLWLAWIARAADDEGLRSRLLPIPPGALMAAAAPLFLAGIVLLPGPPRNAEYTPSAIQAIPGWVDGVMIFCGLAALLLLALRLSPSRASAHAGLLLIAVLILQAVIQLRYGTWVEARSRRPVPTLDQMNERKRSDLAFRGVAGYGMESANRLKPSAASSPFVSFRRTDEWPPTPGVERPVIAGTDRVTGTYVSFNRFVFRSEAAGDGFLHLKVPWSRRWEATVDSVGSRIYINDGNGMAVALPAGTHEVEFRFVSRSSVAGMAVACVTAMLVGLYCARHAPRGWTRVGVIVAALVLPVGCFATWHHGLYHGDDLGTRYQWVSSR